MTDERLDEKSEVAVGQCILETIKFVVEKLPCRDTEYSDLNIAFNIFTGCIATLALNNIEEEFQEEFIKHIGNNLKQNFEANNARRRG